MSKDITITSKTSGTVLISVPELTLTRRWVKKGMKLKIDSDVLKQAYFYPGVEYMFKSGILYIEDLDFKKEIGLEPEDATQPVNILDINDNFLHRCISVMPVSELKEVLTKLTEDQKHEFYDYAVNHYNELKIDRAEIIDNALNTNILRAIELKKQMEVE